MIQAPQLSRYLRPSNHWPITLAAVGNASHHGTSVLVKFFRNRPVAGQASAITANNRQRCAGASARTCRALPSGSVPRTHCHQPHTAISAKNTCSAASPYRRLFQNSATYSDELTMANGHATGLTRMLNSTMATAKTKATTSSQLTPEPHSVNAGDHSGDQALKN